MKRFNPDAPDEDGIFVPPGDAAGASVNLVPAFGLCIIQRAEGGDIRAVHFFISVVHIVNEGAVRSVCVVILPSDVGFKASENARQSEGENQQREGRDQENDHEEKGAFGQRNSGDTMTGVGYRSCMAYRSRGIVR